MSTYNLLMARIDQELVNLERTVNRAVSQVQKAQRLNDADFYDAAALNLQKFYMGAERIFVEIAREIDSNLPSGADWHKRLLEQMMLENGEVRPVVLSLETYQMLEMDYRGFRHVATHLYAFDLKHNKIISLAEMLPDCFLLLKKDMHNFYRYLKIVDQHMNS